MTSRGNKEGFSELKGNNVKKWARHWLVAKEGWLNYYPNESAKEAEVVASIPLSGCVIQILPKKETKKDFVLNLSSPTKKLKSDLMISFETENEMNLWLKVIQDGIMLSSTQIFGVDLELVVIKKKSPIPPLLLNSASYLENYKDTEGIFRISGTTDDVNAYKQTMDAGQELNFSDCKNPHNVANLFKLFLRELPNPLLTFERYDQFVSIAKSAVSEKPSKVTSLIEDLPKPNRDTLLFLLEKFGERSSVNKMTFLNLAVVFGPTIVKAKEETLETAGNNDLVNSLTEWMITNIDSLKSKPVVSTPVSTNNPNVSQAVPQKRTLVPIPGLSSDELARKVSSRSFVEPSKTNSPAPVNPGPQPVLRPVATKAKQSENPPAPIGPSALKPANRNPTPGTPNQAPLKPASRPASVRDPGDFQPNPLQKASSATDSIVHKPDVGPPVKKSVSDTNIYNVPPKRANTITEVPASLKTESLSLQFLESKLQQLEELQKKNQELIKLISTYVK